MCRLDNYPRPVILQNGEGFPVLFTSAVTREKLFLASARPIVNAGIDIPLLDLAKLWLIFDPESIGICTSPASMWLLAAQDKNKLKRFLL